MAAMFVVRLGRNERTLKGPYIDASCQVWFHLAQQFQRRRLKCELWTDDGRQMTRRRPMTKAHTVLRTRWANNGQLNSFSVRDIAKLIMRTLTSTEIFIYSILRWLVQLWRLFPQRVCKTTILPRNHHFS